MSFEGIGQDLRFAWRGLLHAPAFTAVAILTLAVGISGAAVMFALVYGVLLRPLPVREQNRLIVGWQQSRSTGLSHFPFSVSEIEQIQGGSTFLENAAGSSYYGAGSTVAVEDGTASYINTASVTGGFFSVVGVKPVAGRALEPADDVDGAENVLVLTDLLWQRRYGRSRDVIGRRMSVAGRPFTIVGVMPADFEFPRGTEAWMTLAADAATISNGAFRESARRDVDVVARLRPGATIAQASGELRALGNAFDQPAHIVRPDLVPMLHSFDEAVVGDVRPAMLVLLAAVCLVLFVAIANAANLLLVRWEARRAELAVRAALGASLVRLAMPTLLECLLVGTAAGCVGLAAAFSSLKVLVALVPGGLPRAQAVRLDGFVVLFTASVALGSAALAGLAVVAHSARTNLASQLRDGERGVSQHSVRRTRRALVIGQVVLAVVVLHASGLLTRTMVRLQTIDMGISSDSLVFVELDLPDRYSNDSRHLQFLNEVVGQLEAAPAISAATPVNTPPFSGTQGWDVLTYVAEAQDAARASTNPSVNLESVHPTYFKTLGVQLVRGRPFTAVDRQGAPNVAIVTEDVAARLWPGEDPVGKRLKFGRPESAEPWRTIVGVARPTRYRELTIERATVYVPAEQFIAAARMLVVRSTSPLDQVAPVIRERVNAVDPEVRVMRVAAFPELLDGPLARPRFNAFVVDVFGVAALLLTAIGMYAVIAVATRQRYKEIGIRLALGATGPDVLRLVIGDGLRLATIGTLLGVFGAALAALPLRGLLFDLRPLDSPSLALAILLPLTVAALASYLPARHATRISPTDTLRDN